MVALENQEMLWGRYDQLRVSRGNLLRGYDLRITNPDKYKPSTVSWREKIISRIQKELNKLEIALQITLTAKADFSYETAQQRMRKVAQDAEVIDL